MVGKIQRLLSMINLNGKARCSSFQIQRIILRFIQIKVIINISIVSGWAKRSFVFVVVEGSHAIVAHLRMFRAS